MTTEQTTAERSALDLWSHIYGDTRGLLQIYTAERDGDRLAFSQGRYYQYPTEASSATSWALEESGRGREVYFCAHLLTDTRRIKENAAEVRSLWADLDGSPIPNGSLRPTAIVESSPGRFHVYYRLTDSIPPELAELLNKRLAHKTEADPSGFDLGQLLRVPGTHNHKTGDRPPVELRHTSGESYTPAELEELLPELPEPKRNGHRVAYSDDGEPPVQLTDRAREVFEGKQPKLKEDGRVDRSATLVKIGRVMYDAGATRATIAPALQERDAALGYRKFSDRADADERYHEIVDELERNGRGGADGTAAKLIIPRTTTAEPIGATNFNTTDIGNAARLIHHYGDRLRYCYPWGKWLVFDGRRWRVDDTGEVYRFAKETIAAIYQEAADAPDEDRRKALAKHAMRSEGGARIREMIELARSEVPVTPDELDADPWLLNCKNGTVDLRTGELRDHDRHDLITKLAPVEHDPNVAAPTWEKFLQRGLPGEELRGFVQRAAGYSATGDTSEQVMFINHGAGANGKSTYQETISAALGDYALRTPTETLLARRPGGVPNDIARLKGARFVTASETEEGRRLAESLVKDLTGQDTITARYMRAEFFDFKPTHKLHLSTNHRPEIRGTDNAIWRRIRLIPWTVTIPPAEQNKKLPEKLRDELPGVLAWIVQGCLEWRRIGLQAPDEVKAATEGYRAEMDILAGYIEDCCVLNPSISTRATPLYHAYREWAEQTGERIETQRRFGMRLTERGFEREKVGGVYYWLGIGLRHLDPGPPDDISGPLPPNGPDRENPHFAGKTETDSGSTGPLGPESNITAQKNTPREVIANPGPDGPNGPARDAAAGVEDGPVWLD